MDLDGNSTTRQLGKGKRIFRIRSNESAFLDIGWYWCVTPRHAVLYILIMAISRTTSRCPAAAFAASLVGCERTGSPESSEHPKMQCLGCERKTCPQNLLPRKEKSIPVIWVWVKRVKPLWSPLVHTKITVPDVHSPVIQGISYYFIVYTAT